jgi:hypothetical protein
MVVWLSPLCAGRPSPAVRFLVLISVIGWVDQWLWCLPLTWGWKQTQFPKRCVLVSRIPEDGQSRKPSNSMQYSCYLKHMYDAYCTILPKFSAPTPSQSLFIDIPQKRQYGRNGRWSPLIFLQKFHCIWNIRKHFTCWNTLYNAKKNQNCF